jgi:hypothetical protein
MELGWISRFGKDVAAVLRDYRNYVQKAGRKNGPLEQTV